MSISLADIMQELKALRQEVVDLRQTVAAAPVAVVPVPVERQAKDRALEFQLYRDALKNAKTPEEEKEIKRRWTEKRMAEAGLAPQRKKKAGKGQLRAVNP